MILIFFYRNIAPVIHSWLTNLENKIIINSFVLFVKLLKLRKPKVLLSMVIFLSKIIAIFVCFMSVLFNLTFMNAVHEKV